MLQVLRTLCHPLQQSRFMSGGAKRSSLNQTLNEISFFLPVDALSIHILLYIASKKPQILDLARKQSTALGPGSEGNELGCFSSTPLYFVLRARSACASRAIGALLSSYFFIGRLGWTSPFFPNENKWKGLYHIEMSIRFPPQMRWGISHLCPFIFLN